MMPAVVRIDTALQAGLYNHSSGTFCPTAGTPSYSSGTFPYEYWRVERFYSGNCTGSWSHKFVQTHVVSSSCPANSQVSGPSRLQLRSAPWNSDHGASPTPSRSSGRSSVAERIQSMPVQAAELVPVEGSALQERADALIAGDAEAAEDVEIQPRVAAHVGEGADDEHGRVDAALRQGAGDHEPVAAVVTAAAEDGDASVEARLVRRFDGGHHLAPGVLHEDERGNADVFDGEPVGLAHLRCVQDSHWAEV